MAFRLVICICEANIFRAKEILLTSFIKLVPGPELHGSAYHKQIISASYTFRLMCPRGQRGTSVLIPYVRIGSCEQDIVQY